MIERNKPKDCITKPELAVDVPDLCRAQLKTFLECKKGIMDMSKRMRGNGALSTGKYDDEYNRLCTGDFDPHAEMSKLKKLDANQKI